MLTPFRGLLGDKEIVIEDDKSRPANEQKYAPGDLVVPATTTVALGQRSCDRDYLLSLAVRRPASS